MDFFAMHSEDMPVIFPVELSENFSNLYPDLGYYPDLNASTYPKSQYLSGPYPGETTISQHPEVNVQSTPAGLNYNG